MSVDDPLIANVARAVLDGTPVDWQTLESAADAQTLPLLRELRRLSDLAGIHRESDVDGHPATKTAEDVLRAAASAPLATWGHLKVLDRVGQGTFGAVYRAWDTRLDREVALKIVPADEPAGDANASVIDEGRMLARVRHPNVVTIYGADRIGEEIGLWMEFVHGRTLEAELRDGITCSEQDVERIGIELCRALSAVHAAGLLHRDIKAANVMRAQDGRIVLMDFGTGHALGDETAGLSGTPMYLAPEILEGGAASVASDIYSVGVLLYRLLTGRYPVDAASLDDLRRAHTAARQSPAGTVKPDLPAALGHVVLRALDSNPKRRYATAAAMAAALEAVGQQRTRRWFVVVGLLAATVLSSIALVVSGSFGGSRPPVQAAPPPPARLAVLPFEHLGPVPDNDALAQGLTHEIHRSLAGLEGLTLRAFSSSSKFPPGRRDLTDVAAQLDVDLLLEGSVMHAGDRLRVIPRLIRVADRTTIWTEVFESDLKTLLDDIPLAVVNRLRLTIGPHRRRYDLSPDLLVLMVRARGLQARRAPADAAQASTLFRQIVDRDPSYAPGWAGLVSATTQALRLGSGTDRRVLPPELADAAVRAVQLDPYLADAQAAMASLFAEQRQWAQAEAGFRRALDLDSSLTTTHTDFALSTLMPLGRIEEAIGVLETARIADPLSLDVRRVMALMQVELGRYDDAIASSRWVLDRDPTFPFARIWLGRALALSGRHADALRVFGEEPVLWAYYGHTLAVAGRRTEAEAIAAQHAGDPRVLLMVYAGLGDRERALTALERMAEDDWWRAATWMTRPEVSIVRDDPRFNSIRRRVLGQ